MDLNEFKDNLDKIGGPRSNMLFETFVLKLLEEYFRKKSKPFFPHHSYKSENGKNFEFDAYAPEGIDDLPGPALIEIKYSASSVAIKNLNNYFHALLHILPRSDKNGDENGASFQNLFLIFGDILSNDSKWNIKKISDANYLRLKLWDLEDLLNITNDDSFEKINSLKELSELALNDAIAKSLKRTSEGRLEKKKSNINRLTEIYKNKGIVLFLGSGISNEVGIPLWDTLISNLLVEMISEKLVEKSIVINDFERDAIIEKLKIENDTSPLLQARYIRTGLGKNFINIISKILYMNFRKPNDRWPESLEVLSQLCLPRRSGRGGVRAVITYNFDDVFERVLNERGIDCVSIYREPDIPSQDELGIYHVHGFLPYDTDDEEKLSQSLLVFSEEGYHSLLLDPYSWQNIIQLNFLRESTCVMVGLSLIDPNLRRLLAISASNSEYPKHFVILPRIIFDNNSNSVRGNVFQSFTSVNEELQEKSYQELGLNTIWAEDLEEIPGILTYLKKRDKNDS